MYLNRNKLSFHAMFMVEHISHILCICAVSREIFMFMDNFNHVNMAQIFVKLIFMKNVQQINLNWIDNV